MAPGGDAELLHGSPRITRRHNPLTPSPADTFAARVAGVTDAIGGGSPISFSLPIGGGSPISFSLPPDDLRRREQRLLPPRHDDDDAGDGDGDHDHDHPHGCAGTLPTSPADADAELTEQLLPCPSDGSTARGGGSETGVGEMAGHSHLPRDRHDEAETTWAAYFWWSLGFNKTPSRRVVQQLVSPCSPCSLLLQQRTAHNAAPIAELWPDAAWRVMPFAA